MNNLYKINERELQEHIAKLLSDPSIIRSTESGKRLQMLSPGRLNTEEGPDFLEIAVLLDGFVVVGDAEFHKKASDWNRHLHSSDKRYRDVILHIVLDNNSQITDTKFETLLINQEELEAVMQGSEEAVFPESDVNSLEELQHYSLLRLLRKTSDAQKLININGLERAVGQMTADYIERYRQKKNRRVYNDDELTSFPQKIMQTPVNDFLNLVSAGESVLIPDKMQSLIKTKLMGEGAHFRRELILNCILPLAICLANEEARINLFLWYWSTPALHSYGILKRRFKGYPQNFLWQQQGMLEYIKEHGRRSNIMADAIKTYGFGEVLSFYRLGKSPYYLSQDD